jgi:hypothetical protein
VKDVNGRIRTKENYAGLVFVARGIRRARIPRILVAPDHTH